MVNIFLKIFCNSKINDIFISRKKNFGCFTANNNIGFYSRETFNDFFEAKSIFNDLNYVNPTYVYRDKDNIYLSYEKDYNPIITKRVYRYEDSESIEHKWIVTDENGKITKSILINKTNK